MHTAKLNSVDDLSTPSPRTGRNAETPRRHALAALERTSFARATYEAALLQRLPARVQAVIREQLLILDATEAGIHAFGELRTTQDAKGVTPCSSKP